MRKTTSFLKSIVLGSAIFAIALNVNSQNLKNNPIDKSPTSTGDLISGTTFSIADNSEQTDLSHFTQDTILVYPEQYSYFLLNSIYTDGYGNFADGGTLIAPKYAIVSNPKVLKSTYPAKTDNVNRFIFRAPNTKTDIFYYRTDRHKANTAVHVEFTIQELSNSDHSKFDVTVNGNLQSFTLGAGETKNIDLYYSSANPGMDISTIDVIVKRPDWNNGSNCVYALSNFQVRGTIIENFISVSNDQKDGRLGTMADIFLNSTSTPTSIKWQYTDNPSTGTWYDIPAFDDQDTLKVNPNAGKVYYKAIVDNSGVIKESNVLEINRYIYCDGTSRNVFFEDFGTLNGPDDKKRSTSVYCPYIYVPECLPIKDEAMLGEYAVIANPKWGGYDEISSTANSCNPPASPNTNFWYRNDNFLDHTQSGEVAGKFGGMLMLNCRGGANDVLYERTVTGICGNIYMNFSAWFANACEGAGKDPIHTQFRVLDENGIIIPSATIDVNGIRPEDRWVKGETSFYSGTNTQLTIQILNNNSGGNGNDILIDDIAFSICMPQVDLFARSDNEYSIEGDTLFATCGDEITLYIDSTQYSTLYSNPEFLWASRTIDPTTGDLTAWTENAALGNDSTANVITTTDYTQYKVVIANSLAEARAYLNGTTGACDWVAVSEYMGIKCKPLSISVKERNCNSITLETSNSEEPVTWFKKLPSETTWTQLTETTREITLDITEETEFYAQISLGVSEPITVQYYNVEISFVTPKDPYMFGDEINIAATYYNMPANEFQWVVNGNIANWADKDAFKDEAIKASKYYLIADGCKSNELSTNVEWPTVFTPYTIDTKNDDFMVGNDIHLTIFDRYGNKVADTTDGWNGVNAAGKLATPGVYSYIAKSADGEVLRKGTVEIFVGK